MNDVINYKNSPLNGIGLKKLLIEMVDHYGFEILFAYLNINCFKTNPSIDSSVKFLKKTNWAREKVESFYMYEFKGLPKPTPEQAELSPRDRIVPDDQKPGKPAELSLEDAELLREDREKKAAEWKKDKSSRPTSAKSSGAKRSKSSNDRPKKPVPESNNSADDAVEGKVDPWANSKKMNRE